jgi:hypothetical protein
MKELVSDRRISLAVSIAVLLLGWSVVVNPIVSWPGVLSLAALGTLLVASTFVLLMGRLRSPAASMADTIQGVDKEITAGPRVRGRGRGRVIL